MYIDAIVDLVPRIVYTSYGSNEELCALEDIDALSAFHINLIPIILSYNDKFSFLMHEKHYYDTPKP